MGGTDSNSRPGIEPTVKISLWPYVPKIPIRVLCPVVKFKEIFYKKNSLGHILLLP